jgi:hypothetical protein
MGESTWRATPISCMSTLRRARSQQVLPTVRYFLPDTVTGVPATVVVHRRPSHVGGGAAVGGEMLRDDVRVDIDPADSVRVPRSHQRGAAVEAFIAENAAGSCAFIAAIAFFAVSSVSGPSSGSGIGWKTLSRTFTSALAM